MRWTTTITHNKKIIITGIQCYRIKKEEDKQDIDERRWEVRT